MNMLVYRDLEIERELSANVRHHPWTTAEADSRNRYVDFTKRPDAIPEVLEDFRGLHGEMGVQSFFELLRDVNRPGGFLETNDCAFRAAESGDGTDCPPQLRDTHTPTMRSSGRLMFLFREWAANLSEQFTDALMGSFAQAIDARPAKSKTAIGLSFCPIMFPSINEQPVGRQLVASWWTWGDSEREVLDGLREVVLAMRASVDLVEEAIQQDNPNTTADTEESAS